MRSLLCQASSYLYIIYLVFNWSFVGIRSWHFLSLELSMTSLSNKMSMLQFELNFAFSHTFFPSISHTPINNNHHGNDNHSRKKKQLSEVIKRQFSGAKDSIVIVLNGGHLNWIMEIHFNNWKIAGKINQLSVWNNLQLIWFIIIARTITLIEINKQKPIEFIYISIETVQRAWKFSARWATLSRKTNICWTQGSAWSSGLTPKIRSIFSMLPGPWGRQLESQLSQKM